MRSPDADEMLWFADRWWWFPGSRIDAESEFEWRKGRAYLLELDGSAEEGIVFAGKVAAD